jgi:exopolysaccharide biosynthesis protein
MRPVSTPEFNKQHGSSETTPAAGAGLSTAKPPILATPMSAPAKKLSPIAITAICIGSVGALAVAGLLTVGMLVRARAADTREAKGQRVRAAESVRQTALATASAEPTAAKSNDGISYRNDRIPSEPWSIHVLKIDRSRKDLIFYSAHARNKVLAVSMIADQARTVPREIGRAIAGVNGDFYVRDSPTYSGDPRGLQIVNGELISAPDTVCVWFDADGNPHLDEVKGNFTVTWPNGSKTPFGLNQQRPSNGAVLYTPTLGLSTRAMGGRELILEPDGDGPWLPLQTGETYRARVRDIATNGNTRLTSNVMVLSIGPRLANLPEITNGTTLQLTTATTPDLKGVKSAIAGGPALIRNGKAFSGKTAPAGIGNNYAERSRYERHPRSAIGWSSTHIYLVTVDGRQPGLSVGMKLAELAEYFVKLGCTEAMNLDGGKSAQMWLNGQIMNNPAQGEDTVANSLLVVRKPKD